MPPRPDLRARSDRIELLVEELRLGEARCAERAEELLSLVCELYGEGLSRVVELVASSDEALLQRFVDDDVIASLLLVHGLHPVELADRVQRALDSVRPLLGAHGGDVEVVELDAVTGALRLRLLGSCDGCPSSSLTLRLAVERAVLDAAPEVVTIDVVEASGPLLAQDPQPSGSDGDLAPRPGKQSPASVPIMLRPRPAYDHCPAEQKGA
jgi:Fe-S cluster biogenesis protein NfuA